MKILLVIDIQKQFADNDGEYDKIIDFCNNNRDNYDVILPTVFKNEKGSNFMKHLNYNDCVDSKNGDNAILPKTVNVEIKSGYASKKILDICNKQEDIIDIVGCDSDACIMATCFKLWDAGYDFRVLSQYIYSSNDKYGFTNDNVIEIMRRNFGNCVI
jgi:hypothetical protein